MLRVVSNNCVIEAGEDVRREMLRWSVRQPSPAGLPLDQHWEPHTTSILLSVMCIWLRMTNIRRRILAECSGVRVFGRLKMSAPGCTSLFVSGRRSKDSEPSAGGTNHRDRWFLVIGKMELQYKHLATLEKIHDGCTSRESIESVLTLTEYLERARAQR